MNTKDKINVMQAFLDGKVIQIFTQFSEKWRDMTMEPEWNWQDINYRIKPQKQLVIPWEHIKSQYEWAAMDRDKNLFIYVNTPECCVEDDAWKIGQEGGWCRDLEFLSIDADGIDWKQSLVQRPKGV